MANRSGVFWDEAELNKLIKSIEELQLTDREKREICKQAGNEMKGELEKDSKVPEAEGDLKVGFEVKTSAKSSGAVLTNNVEADSDGARYAFILNYKEGKHLGYFDKLTDEYEDIAAESIKEQVMKKLTDKFKG